MIIQSPPSSVRHRFLPGLLAAAEAPAKTTPLSRVQPIRAGRCPDSAVIARGRMREFSTDPLGNSAFN